MDSSAPILSVETLASHLEMRGTPYELNELNGAQVVALVIDFGTVELKAIFSVAQINVHTVRLELAGFTPDFSVSRDEEALETLNAVNRRSGFTRSIDDECALWVEYVGFYPLECPFPQGTFDTLMGGFIHHTVEALKALQMVPEDPEEGG